MKRKYTYRAWRPDGRTCFTVTGPYARAATVGEALNRARLPVHVVAFVMGRFYVAPNCVVPKGK